MSKSSGNNAGAQSQFFWTMDKSTVIGMIGGFALVISAIVTQGDIAIFISASSVVIVCGGVFSSAFVNYSIDDTKNALALLFETLKTRQSDFRTDIEMMNMFVRKARREGLLKLEEDIQDIDSGYLKNALMLALDGTSREALVKILDDEIRSSQRMLSTSVKILKSMAEYSPAFGMIGTVIGLVLMLQNISDPESLGAGLAVALLTTLYGTICANMIFTPLGGKLDHMGKRQILRNEMFMSAILSLVDEENPRIMESKMLNYLLPGERAEYLAYFDDKSFDKKREEKLYANWKETQLLPWTNLKTVVEAG